MTNDPVVIPCQKIIFIATNNPQGNEPLWPKPHGCTGYGLWRLINDAMGWEREEYLMRTDRRNIIESPFWNEQQALQNIEKLKQDIDGRKSIIIGAVAARLFDVDEICVWEGNIATIPSPAFVNPFYKEKSNYDGVVRFLQEALQ